MIYLYILKVLSNYILGKSMFCILFKDNIVYF